MRQGAEGGSEGEREGRRRETAFCRSVFAFASNSAFTASMSLFSAAHISAVYPSCRQRRSVSAAPAHTRLHPRHTHVETSNTVDGMPSTLYAPLPYAGTSDCTV